MTGKVARLRSSPDLAVMVTSYCPAMEPLIVRVAVQLGKQDIVESVVVNPDGAAEAAREINCEVPLITLILIG